MIDRTIVNLSEIKTEPKRFQFRLGNIAEDGTRGILAEVEVFNPIFVGYILLWQDKSGQLFLVDGHERLALAKRLRVSQLECFVMKQTDNITVEDALKKGVDVNIAKRHYSVSELAVIFKKYGITLDYLRKKMINADCEENLQALSMLNL
jgi:hypothetical protein